MNTANLTKWIDELQAQIDDVKKNMGGSDTGLADRVTALESLPIAFHGVLITTDITVSEERIEFNITLPVDASAYDFKLATEVVVSHDSYNWTAPLTLESVTPIIKSGLADTEHNAITGTFGYYQQTISEGVMNVVQIPTVGSIGLDSSSIADASVTVEYILFATKKPPVTTKNRRKKK